MAGTVPSSSSTRVLIVAAALVLYAVCPAALRMRDVRKYEREREREKKKRKRERERESEREREREIERESMRCRLGKPTQPANAPRDEEPNRSGHEPKAPSTIRGPALHEGHLNAAESQKKCGPKFNCTKASQLQRPNPILRGRENGEMSLQHSGSRSQ